MLLCITSDDKLLHIFGIVIMTTKLQYKKKQKKISQILQHKMYFPLLHYTNKKEKKSHECCKKKT